jgi:hypothetical protein
MKRWPTCALLLMASGVAAACPLCGDWLDSMPAQGAAYRQRAVPASTAEGGTQLEVIDAIRSEVPTGGASETAAVYRLDRDAAANAVLALPDGRGSRLKVVEVIQGDFPLGGAIESAWVDRVDPRTPVGTKPLLLIRARTWQSWANLGPIGAEHARWLRKLAASKPATNLTEGEWQTHVALALPYLENAEPMVAEIAYGELARAPYSAMRSLRALLDAGALRQWAADPRLAKRQSLYTLLLGVAGDATDAARIEQRLEATWNAKDATNLGPMLAADLELRGPSRMAWIDVKYMSDRDRTTRELQAVLLALSVQGAANATIPRERVIESYRTFIDGHKALAGFVAQDLAAWNYWDAGPEYVALLRSDLAQHPASRYAMLNYLKQSPRADAKAAVDASAIARQ